MNAIYYEACLTKSINDELKNGFWCKLEPNNFYFIYDEDSQKIVDLHNITLGIEPPLVGNVIYEDQALWSLSESKRSQFIKINIATFSSYELNEIYDKTIYKIFWDEIFLLIEKPIKIKQLINQYLKLHNLFHIQEKKFCELDLELQVKVIYLKLIYKKPKWICLNLLNWNNSRLEVNAFLVHLKKLLLTENICCLLFSNALIKEFDNNMIKLSSKKYYNLINSTYTIVPKPAITKANIFLIFKPFFLSLFFFLKKEKIAWCLYSFFLIIFLIFTNIICVINFHEILNWKNPIDINLLIKSLFLTSFIAVNSYVLFLFIKKYKLNFNFISFLITKGYNRLFCLNWYVVIDVFLLIFGTLISIVIDLILQETLLLTIYFSSMIWPLIVYLSIHSFALSFHYFYFFKIYKISEKTNFT